jgi:hypothetical protein
MPFLLPISKIGITYTSFTDADAPSSLAKIAIIYQIIKQSFTSL